jgi:hypothetical protein
MTAHRLHASRASQMRVETTAPVQEYAEISQKLRPTLTTAMLTWQVVRTPWRPAPVRLSAAR